MNRSIATIALMTAFLYPDSVRAEDTPAELSYILPKMRISAAIKHRIASCPILPPENGKKDQGDPRFNIVYDTKIVGKAAPDRLVVVNADSGFLVDRTTQIKLTSEGYLKEFNATSTGQGGPIVSSLIKAGVVVASFAASPLAGAAAAGAITTNSFKSANLSDRNDNGSREQRFQVRWYITCSEQVARTLKDLATVNADIKTLEDAIVAGGSDDAGVLAVRRAEADALRQKLTITVETEKPLDPISLREATPRFENTAITLPEAPIDSWFEVVPVTIDVTDEKAAGTAPIMRKPDSRTLLLTSSPEPIVGIHGYLLTVRPASPQAKWFGCDTVAKSKQECSEYDKTTDPIKMRNLVYRRAVPSTAALAPLFAPCPNFKTDKCPDAPAGWKNADQASATVQVNLPQLSRLYFLPTHGGIFGSRKVAAEFGPGGEPLMLQFDRGGGGKDIAGVIDTSAAAATSLRDARLDATKRDIARYKAEKELEDLLIEQLDTAP